MISIRAAFAVILYVVFSATVSAAKVQPVLSISTPTPEVYVNDLIIIDVEATALESDPSFDILFKELTLIRQTYGTRIAVIQGEVVETKIWRFEASTDTPGKRVLGPLRVEETLSNVISTTVTTAPDVVWSPAQSDVIFNVEWSNASPYVQEQLVMTMTLKHRYPVNRISIREPEFDGFRVIPLIVDRRTEIEDDGETLFQLVRRYALFAQNSGEYEIPLVRVSGEIIKSRLERAAFELQSAEQIITIKPVPDAAKGLWWLPSLNVDAEDEWSKDKRWLNAGEQVQRTGVVKASGVSADQLPEIEFPEAQGLRMTHVETVRETHIHDNGISAEARYIYNVRALSPIPVFPDPVFIDWWDTTQNKARRAIIRTGRIDIGAPSREAMLAAVQDSQRPLDALIAYKRPLMLLTLVCVLFALLLNAAAVKNFFTKIYLAARVFLKKKMLERRLLSAARAKDISKFTSDFYRWKQTVGMSDSTRHSLQNVERVLFGRGSQDELVPAVKNLLK